MPFPPILKAVARLHPVGALAVSALGGARAATSGAPRRHRRRRALTKGELADISYLSSTISKKAAENYLLRRR